MLVDTPTPPQTSKDSYYEDTMLLLDMVREKKQKENQEKKVWVQNKKLRITMFQDAKIRAMALEQKRKKQP